MLYKILFSKYLYFYLQDLFLLLEPTFLFTDQEMDSLQIPFRNLVPDHEFREHDSHL